LADYTDHRTIELLQNIGYCDHHIIFVVYENFECFSKTVFGFFCFCFIVCKFHIRKFFNTSLLIQAVTFQFVEAMGGGANGWRTVAIIYAVIGLIVAVRAEYAMLFAV